MKNGFLGFNSIDSQLHFNRNIDKTLYDLLDRHTIQCNLESIEVLVYRHLFHCGDCRTMENGFLNFKSNTYQEVKVDKSIGITAGTGPVILKIWGSYDDY